MDEKELEELRLDAPGILDNWSKVKQDDAKGCVLHNGTRYKHPRILLGGPEKYRSLSWVSAQEHSDFAAFNIYPDGTNKVQLIFRWQWTVASIRVFESPYSWIQNVKLNIECAPNFRPYPICGGFKHVLHDWMDRQTKGRYAVPTLFVRYYWLMLPPARPHWQMSGEPNLEIRGGESEFSKTMPLVCRKTQIKRGGQTCQKDLTGFIDRLR